MEFLNESIIKTVQKRKTILPEILITESIININKETFSKCFDELRKFLENYQSSETTEYISYLLYITINIRPKSRKLIAELVKGLLQNSFFRECNFNKYLPVLTIVKELQSNNQPEIELYNEGSFGKIIFDDNIDDFIRLGLTKEQHAFYSCSIDTFMQIEKREYSLFEMAALHGSVKCFKYILINDKKINKSICKFAVIGGSKEIINILIANEIDFSSCASTCIAYHRIDLYDLILNDSNIDSSSINECMTFINNAALCYIENNFGILAIRNHIDNNTLKLPLLHGNINAYMFFLKGIDISSIFNEKDKNGNTLLHYACLKGFLKISELMMQNGANPNSLNNDLEIPYHYAAKYCDANSKVFISEGKLKTGYILFTEKAKIKEAAQKHTLIDAIGNTIYKFPKKTEFLRTELKESLSYLEFFDFLFSLPDMHWKVNDFNHKGKKCTCSLSIKFQENVRVFGISIDKVNETISIKCYRPYLLNFQKINDGFISFMIPRFDEKELSLIKKQAKAYATSVETMEMLSSFAHKLFRGNNGLPDYLGILFFSRSTVYKIKKQEKININYSFLENLRGIVEIQNEKTPIGFSPLLRRLFIEGSSVHSFVYIDLRAFKVVQSSSCIELDCTFDALSPYVLNIPVAIIKNEEIPLGFSMGPSESHCVYQNFYDLFESRFPGVLKNKPILSDEGSGLLYFCNMIKQSNPYFKHFLCFRHIIEKFGSSESLAKLVSYLLYSFSEKEFLEKWDLKRKQITSEVINSKHQKQFCSIFKCEITHNGEISDPDVENITQLPWNRSELSVPLTTNHVESIHGKLNKKLQDVRTLEESIVKILEYFDKRYLKVQKRRNLTDNIKEVKRNFKKTKDKPDHQTCIARCNFYSKLYQITEFPCVHTIENFNAESIPQLIPYNIYSEEIYNIDTTLSVVTQKNCEWNFKDLMIFEKQGNEQLDNSIRKENSKEKNPKKEKVHNETLVSMLLLNEETNQSFPALVKELNDSEKLELNSRYPALIINSEDKEHIFVPNLSLYDGEYVADNNLGDISKFKIVLCIFKIDGKKKFVSKYAKGITKVMKGTEKVLIGFTI